MTPLEKRIADLKQLLKENEALPEPPQLYIEDLKLTIKQCEAQLPKQSKQGYVMVE